MSKDTNDLFIGGTQLLTHTAPAAGVLFIASPDPPNRPMYYHLGPNSDGLEVVRAMRGSPKVEVANKVAEHALATTGKMTKEMADGEYVSASAASLAVCASAAAFSGVSGYRGAFRQPCDH